MINQQINLYQPIFRRERKLLSFDALLQIILIAIVSLALVYEYGVWSGYRLQQTAASLRNLKTEKLLLLERLQHEQARPQDALPADRVLAELQQEYAARKQLLESMSNIGQLHSHGFSEYLEAFSKKTLPGMWLTGFSASGDGRDLELRGGARDPHTIPEFVQSFADVPVLTTMKFRMLQIERVDAGKQWVDFILSTDTEVSRGME